MTSLRGKRVLITGAARGIGAALARRLHERGARVALAGLEPKLLEGVARRCSAPWRECDVGDRAQIEHAVAELVDALGGLDIVVANAGIARQLPLVGGDPEVFEQTVRVNLLGCYYTARAAGVHIGHHAGYAVLISSLAAAVHPPLMGAYSSSKAAVEALGNTLRAELAPTGARVGVAYFAELDTDMTHRGFGTAAAAVLTGGGPIGSVAPIDTGIAALERGIRRRSKRIVAPRWVRAAVFARPLTQWIVDRHVRHRVADAVRIARSEAAPYTTAQPTGGHDSWPRPPQPHPGERDTNQPQARDQTEPFAPNATNTMGAGDAGAPRLTPGTWRETGLLAHVLARIAGRRSDTRPLALFRVLGRHRPLLRAWLPLSGLLLRGSALSRYEVELVILRVAHLRGCAYELDHHIRLGRRVGVDPGLVAAGPDAAGWSERDRVLLAGTDALITERTIDDDTWAELRAQLTDRALIELCFLAGHYDLLATTIDALRIPRDTPSRAR